MLIILYLFTEQDATGYVITEKLKERIGSLFTISAGAVYPQLNKLEEDGLVDSKIKYLKEASIRPNEPRKVYNLTIYGKTLIDEIISLWDEIRANAMPFLDEIKLVKEEDKI